MIKLKTISRIVLSLIFFQILIGASLEAQEEVLGKVQEKVREEAGKKLISNPKQKSSVVDFIQKNTDLKEPWKLRNPFKIKLEKKKARQKQKVQQSLGSSDLIKEIDPNAMKIIGVLAGKKKRAFAKFKNSVIILKEGDKIGPDKVELKAILPGGIVVVDRFTNVYGQEEYLETIIPIGDELPGGEANLNGAIPSSVRP